MACTFRSLWVFKISSGRVILTRKFPTVEHRHRSAVTVHRPSPKNSDGEVAQHATESDSKVGSKHDNDLSAALTKIPSRREIERRLRTALGTSQAREHPALPVLDLGGSLWPIVAVVRGDHVLLGLVLVPAGAMATHFDRSRKDEGRQSGAKLMLRLPVVTAAVPVLDMLAEALEQSLQDAATGGEGASTTAELAKVLADITMFMPFGSPVEVSRRFHKLLFYCRAHLIQSSLCGWNSFLCCRQTSASPGNIVATTPVPRPRTKRRNLLA